LRRVWITDARIVTASGGLEETWQGLMAQSSAIREITRFPTGIYGSTVGACINGLAPQEGRSMIHGLLERLFLLPLTLPPGALVITASAKGGIDNLERIHRGEDADAGDILPSRLPFIAASMLHHAEPGFNVSSACASSTVALAKAASMVRSGAVRSIVLLCLDLVSEFVFSGFSALRILSPSPCKPFDRNRDGLSLGEGAALLVLADEDFAKENGLPCRGVIAGAGIANDAVHIVTPAPDGRGLASAVTAALGQACLEPGQVGAISAHGTGTIHNDRAELAAFQSVFGESLPAIYSVKGAVGHTLGAAGGIEASIALRCLAEELVPPTVGFSQGEEQAATHVTERPEPLPHACVLVTNSGFGGVSCALILETSAA
jgi:3-oxoacyl-[acyl-carrier-protein] synthase II